jgi:hypothetical protein
MISIVAGKPLMITEYRTAIKYVGLVKPELLGFWKIENTTFRTLDLFPSSGEGKEDTY